MVTKKFLELSLFNFFRQYSKFLSMYIEGSTFIGFNPSRETSIEAFRNAGVPIIEEKDLRLILPYVFD